MNQSKVTGRYAKALLELSVEKNCLEDSYNDIRLIKKSCLENKELLLLLKSPIIKTDQKLKILNHIFESKTTKMTQLFLKILTKKKREHLLVHISNSFISQYKKYKNIEEASVTTAITLTPELKTEVIKYIKKETKSDIELLEIVDEKIIGGTVIKIGDKQLDASVANEISELRKMFNQNLYKQEV